MPELGHILALVHRFQSLKDMTGCTKADAYFFNLQVDPWRQGHLECHWGCNDVAHYPRNYVTKTTAENLSTHMLSEIEKMESAIAASLHNHP